jgi:hypothetical protein
MKEGLGVIEVFLLLNEAHALGLILSEGSAEVLMDDWLPERRLGEVRTLLAQHPRLTETEVSKLWLVFDAPSQGLMGLFICEGFGVAARELALLPWSDFEQAMGHSFQFSLPAPEQVLAVAANWTSPALASTPKSQASPATPPPSQRRSGPCLEPVEDEVLLTFLPALYQQPFTQISPVDLALLNGRVVPYDLPSPYPEPSEGAQSVLQARFRRLPKAQQAKLLRFVAQLPVPLTPRAAVRSWLESMMVRLDELDERDGHGES